MQFLQDLLASSEERIAQIRNIPGWSECGETGFQELARLLVIQTQDPGQFENHPFALSA